MGVSWYFSAFSAYSASITSVPVPSVVHLQECTAGNTIRKNGGDSAGSPPRSVSAAVSQPETWMSALL